MQKAEIHRRIFWEELQSNLANEHRQNLTLQVWLEACIGT